MSKILTLGCGTKPRKSDADWTECINLDLLPLEGVQVVHDLNVHPWPFEPESFDSVEADNVIEHVNDLIAFVEECHRILKLRRPNGDPGTLVLTGPLAGTMNHLIDPTHKRGLTEYTFDFFDPETPFGREGWFYSPARFRVWKMQVVAGGAKPGEVAFRDVPVGELLPYELCSGPLLHRVPGLDLRFQLIKLPADSRVVELRRVAGHAQRTHAYAHQLNPTEDPIL